MFMLSKRQMRLHGNLIMSIGSLSGPALQVPWPGSQNDFIKNSQELRNIVDDVDHCLQAKTSLQLTEIEFGDGNAVILKVEQNTHKQCYVLSFISARL